MIKKEMCFEDALKQLRIGLHVRRKSWPYGEKLNRNRLENLPHMFSWEDFDANDWVITD